jgi:hypothetical protein
MEALNWERWARASGIAFVVLTVVAFVVGGEPPAADDPAAEVVSYYDGDRGQVLVSSFVFAVALGFWIWFAAAIANNLRERGQGRVAATITTAVATFAALQLVGTALNAVLAYTVARDVDADVAKAFFELTWAVDDLRGSGARLGAGPLPRGSRL